MQENIYKNIYTGLVTALITPFKDGKIDYIAFKKMVELQIKHGTNALVVAGSTGEGSSLNDDDYFDLVKFATSVADKKIPIIAGVSTISTENALNKVKKLSKLDIEGIMCTPPHYIRPEQEGLVAHFEAISFSTDKQIILYANPGRTGVEFSDDTIIKLAQFSNIRALKDAGSDIERPLRLLAKLPFGFNMLTGDDSKTLAYSAHGGRGCVSVVSNILPRECMLLQKHLSFGDFKSALDVQQKLLPIYAAIFSQSNPIGIKCASNIMKLCADEIKLPLTSARAEVRQEIQKALMNYEIAMRNV